MHQFSVPRKDQVPCEDHVLLPLIAKPDGNYRMPYLSHDDPRDRIAGGQDVRSNRPRIRGRGSMRGSL